VVGVFLCILLLSISVPILIGMERSPETFIGGEGTVLLTQTRVNQPLTEDVANRLEAQSYVDRTSAEIYAFCAFRNRLSGDLEPVIVRGVEPDRFFEIDRGRLIRGEKDQGDSFTIIGAELAGRASLHIGDRLVLTGSTVPALLETTITGVFESPTQADDEILISLDDARLLAGLKGDNVLIIRAETADFDRLVDFLESNDISTSVSREGTAPLTLNDKTPYEEQVAQQLGISYSDVSQLHKSNQSFVSTFIRNGIATIGTVIIAFIGLNVALTFIGSTAILGRGILERRKDLGILVSLGASRRDVYFLLTKNFLIISILASGLAVILGFLIGLVVDHLGILVLFGHTVPPILSAEIFLGTFLGSVAIITISGLVIGYIILQEETHRLIRDLDTTQSYVELQTLEELLAT